eukprot:TRINITY_DN3421_c2_g1_i2.p2 TRINITY_DN3421_c2_g1~~TRINITY_DN3421_c2_g1_i2.p2  ORF type:complete len:194 (-),score=57.74 TRINITY_DN3421_c2_g1_i2:262-843(-)
MRSDVVPLFQVVEKQIKAVEKEIQDLKNSGDNNSKDNNNNNNESQLNQLEERKKKLEDEYLKLKKDYEHRPDIPYHWCKVDYNTLRDYPPKPDGTSVQNTQYPLIYQATRFEVDILPGQMLYLPCGWFHEVLSFSDVNSKENGHIALNYWMPPPSNLNNYETPYPDDHWSNIWNIVKPILQQQINHNNNNQNN